MMQDSSSSSPRTTLIIRQHYSIKIRKVFSCHVSRMFSPSRCLDHDFYATSRHAVYINAGQPAGWQWLVIVCITWADCSRNLFVWLPLPVQGQVVPTKQCECDNHFHTQCLSLSFQDAETQVDSHVNMDQCNLDSCLFQHPRQNADQDSPVKNTRRKERALNTKNKNIQGKNYTKGSGKYLHIQECLVYGPVEVSQ